MPSRILAPERHSVGSERGVPASLDGKKLAPVAIIEALEVLAGPFGIGRGIHLGDTVIGTSGPRGFSGGALKADVLLTAHRELENWCSPASRPALLESVAQPYGDLVHEGQHLDPWYKDIEALLLSSQARVGGEVRLLFRPGCLFVEGVRLAVFKLMAASKKACTVNRRANGPRRTRWVIRRCWP